MPSFADSKIAPLGPFKGERASEREAKRSRGFFGASTSNEARTVVAASTNCIRLIPVRRSAWRAALGGQAKAAKGRRRNSGSRSVEIELELRCLIWASSLGALARERATGEGGKTIGPIGRSERKKASCATAASPLARSSSKRTELNKIKAPLQLAKRSSRSLAR